MRHEALLFSLPQPRYADVLLRTNKGQESADDVPFDANPPHTRFFRQRDDNNGLQHILLMLDASTLLICCCCLILMR